MKKILIIGGGIAGLSASIALSKSGHQCHILERDSSPLPQSPVGAFQEWSRPGAPQVRHSHAFLARLRNLLRDRYPDVLTNLLRYGAEELPIQDLLAPTIKNRSAQAGDEDLVMLACRRLTFEWVLRDMADSEPKISFVSGERVIGLSSKSSSHNMPMRVCGVRTASGTEINADLVIDASGRHTHLPEWLKKLGVNSLPIESEDCGIFYCSRFFQLREKFAGDRRDVAVAADLGYIKYAVFHGDANIFSVTLAASPEDPPIQRIMDTEGFETATNAFPATRFWVNRARSEPITKVYTMSKLKNFRSRLVEDGKPTVLGLVALGDASVHTNPLYGRGCTLAFMHTTLLADCLKNHGDDLASLQIEFEAATDRELGPWYEFTRTQDNDAIKIAAAHREGAPASETRVDGTIDPHGYMRALIRDGLLPSMRNDEVVSRKGFRSFNMLEPPGQLMRDPDMLSRVLKTFRERDDRPDLTFGPERSVLIEQLSNLP